MSDKHNYSVTPRPLQIPSLCVIDREGVLFPPVSCAALLILKDLEIEGLKKSLRLCHHFAGCDQTGDDPVCNLDGDACTGQMYIDGEVG